MRPRTFKQAIDEGTCFELKLVAKPEYTSCCPAAETIDEAMACAMRMGSQASQRFVAGERVEVYMVLPGSQTGCTFIASLGVFILPATLDQAQALISGKVTD